MGSFSSLKIRYFEDKVNKMLKRGIGIELQSINQSAFIYLLAPLRGSVAITNNDIVLLKAKTNSTKNWKLR